MHTGGDAHFRAGIQRREAGIAAGANNHIRPEIRKNAPAFLHCVQNTLDGPNILLQALQVHFPTQAGARQALQLVACLGDQPFLHMSNRADKQDPAVRMALPHFIGNGDGRVDVAGSAATGKNQIHRVMPPVFF